MDTLRQNSASRSCRIKHCGSCVLVRNGFFEQALTSGPHAVSYSWPPPSSRTIEPTKDLASPKSMSVLLR